MRCEPSSAVVDVERWRFRQEAPPVQSSLERDEAHVASVWCLGRLSFWARADGGCGGSSAMVSEKRGTGKGDNFEFHAPSDDATGGVRKQNAAGREARL